MENVRNRINFRLISSEEQAFNIRNQLIRYTVFNENLVGVHLAKQCVKLNKPIFIGQCVLDQSKYLMNDFHYNKMLPYFTKDNLDLLFTDTDSLCYHIKNKDPFEYMLNNKDLFDLSNYDKDNVLYDPANNIGKFKHECPNEQITDFIGLRSKMYSYKTEDNKPHKRCKGIKKCIIEEIEHTDMIIA